MKLKTTLIALAVTSLFAAGPAFANGGGNGGNGGGRDDDGPEVELETEWEFENDLEVKGKVYVGGYINIDSEAGALVDQHQKTDDNESDDVDNEAEADESFLYGATGNIGVNLAAGVGNAQANDAAIAEVNDVDQLAIAQVFNTQETEDNDIDGEGENEAEVDDDVLAYATGNIGLNIAAGVGNAQGNAMSLTSGTNGRIAKASSVSWQETDENEIEDCVENSAEIGSNVLLGATGNIGVNIAAGVGNAQHNGLSMATTVSEACTACSP
jgi:hypothetical protein